MTISKNISYVIAAIGISCLLILKDNLVFAQKFNKEALLSISRESIIGITDDDSVFAFMQENGLNSRFINLGNGRKAYLKKVENGMPYYISTYNHQARKTTGVEYIQSSEGLNLDLNGQGITIGVWDGGQILSDHVEFGNRVTNITTEVVDDHATHVAGTIIASGIREDAKGMLPQAEVLGYYAFEDDLVTMALEAANGIILSNHSYGLLLGWNYNSETNEWQWFGGAEEEDVRFGYYSNKSKTLDDIVYNAPYYTVVWAAGNDRSDTGDGTKPPDGPYNIIKPSGSAKNVITVGAITGFDDYVDETSAEMSTFSAWGPTDDGRIKPDLVADGVDVLSTTSSSTDAYFRQNGTSMSTPGVTGSLGLLQQYYLQQEDTFLTAASLKSLAIHTAREAGSNPGPDVQFGWGVINTTDALEVLMARNGIDTLLIDSVLIDQQVQEYSIFSDGNTPITVTIAWTDYPGDPGTPGETTPMLQNDLDIRLVNDEGLEEFPWVLNTSNYNRAIKGDNILDNVEKIVFNNPESRNYKLTVSHKGNLINGSQAYGLTLTGGSIKAVTDPEYYWIASSGNLNIQTNWSGNSGGVPLSSATLANSTIVFDNNSNFANNDIISLKENLEVDNFIWLADSAVTLDLNGDTLTVRRNFKLSTSTLTIRNGVFKFYPETHVEQSLDFNGTDQCSLLIFANDTLEIGSNINLHELKLLSGGISIANRNINLSNFHIATGSYLGLQNSIINVLDTVMFETGNVHSINNTWLINGAVLQINDDTELKDNFNINANSRIEGGLILNRLEILGATLHINNSIEVDSVILDPGSTVNISPMDTLTISNYLQISSTSSNTTSINGTSIDERSYIKLNYRKKLCFDSLSISNIEMLSEAIFNAGENSNLSNTLNIEQKSCDDILYPNFIIPDNNCVNSVLELNDISEGPVETVTWSSQDGIFLSGSNGSRSHVYFTSEGSFDIRLTIQNETSNESFAQSLIIYENLMPEVTVVENSLGLVSDKEGDGYQWYLDGIEIEGEVERTLLEPVESGLYQVAYFINDSTCLNRISPPYELEITSISNEEFEAEGIDIYPNPTEGFVTINGLRDGDEIRIINMMGRELYNEKNRHDISRIDMTNYYDGLYIIHITRDNKTYNTKLLKIK